MYKIFKVQEKFNTKEITWNRAMDEVRTDRLIAKHGKDMLLVIIRDWPASEKYKDKPELVASLEYLVCVVTFNSLSHGDQHQTLYKIFLQQYMDV